jgi:hypothetical protein
MKVESGQFTVNSNNVGVILNDDTIVVDRIYLSVTHATTTSAGASTGFSNGTNHNARSILNYGSGEIPFTTDDYSITHYKRIGGANVLKQAGVVTDLTEAGMVYMYFDNFDAQLTVYFTVEGH